MIYKIFLSAITFIFIINNTSLSDDKIAKLEETALPDVCHDIGFMGDNNREFMYYKFDKDYPNVWPDGLELPEEFFISQGNSILRRQVKHGTILQVDGFYASDLSSSIKWINSSFDEREWLRTLRVTPIDGQMYPTHNDPEEISQLEKLTLIYRPLNEMNSSVDQVNVTLEKSSNNKCKYIYVYISINLNI